MLHSDKNPYKNRFSNVFWIGGGSGAGKTTLARWLEREYNMHLYDTDAAMVRHAQQSNALGCPKLHKFLKMSMDERWILRSPEEMLKSFHWFAGEGFQLIIDDLLVLPSEQIILVEGFRLLPSLVLPYLYSKSQAVWLLPTVEFRKFAFEVRGALLDFPSETSNPQQAIENLMLRDALFTQKLRKEVAKNSFNSIEITETVTKKNVQERIQSLFGFS